MAERRALLIGTSRYQDPALPTLQAPGRETRQLSELLNDPDIGGFAATALIDERKAVVEREIEELFADRGVDDHVLLYLSGHGIKNADNQLFFATTDTRQDRPYSTSIPAVLVQRLLRECQARFKAVVLDCCYSGSFAPGAVAKSGAAVDVSALGEGTFVITATNALDPAFEDERVVFGNSTPYSVFTDALIAGLETGAAARPGSDEISADDLYDFLDRELRKPRADGRVQRPHRLNHGLGEFKVAGARTRRLAVDETTASPRLAELVARDDPAAARALRVPIGQAHRATARGDDLVRLDLAGPDGHVCVVGRIWSGKSTLLRTLIGGLRTGRSPAEVRFVCLDGGGQLADLADTPYVDRVVAPSDTEGVRAALAHVLATIEFRDRLFRAGSIRLTHHYRELRHRNALPPGDHADLFLVVDGWDRFHTRGVAEDVRRIAGTGLGRGVHVVLTARTWSEVPPEIRSLLRGRIELGLDDPRESHHPELSASLPRTAGWGLCDGRPFLTAVQEHDQTEEEINAVAARLARMAGPEPAPADEAAVADPLLSNPPLLDLLGLPNAQAIPGSPSRPPELRHRAAFGVDEHGDPVELDIKEAAEGGTGPHGICVGATGSGKSEFLRTLVLAMMATHKPAELSFVLVDSKGGATFRDLDGAPHVAASVAGLAADPLLVDRLGTALHGEISRRQELVGHRGFSAVPGHRGTRRGWHDLPPLPALFVVVDEFSALLDARPDFIDVFTTIGRLGRSLRIHLLLASYQLEEGRLRELDSYLSYRIGLKTFSAAESRAVLGLADAFELPPVPGSGYLRTVVGEVVRFKAAYVSGSAAGRSTLDEVVAVLPDTGDPVAPIWLPPLGESDPLDRMMPALRTRPGRGLSTGVRRGALTVPLGMVDRPYEQRYEVLLADFSGTAGHAVVAGGPRSGKSALLRTLVLAAALTHTPAEVRFSCLDLGGGTLGPLAGLPHVGDVAGRTDPDRVRRIITECTDLLVERERQFLAEGFDSMAEARRAGVPDVFLVIDGWLNLRQEFEDVEDAVTTIAHRGLTYGVHLVLTVTRWAELRAAVQDLISTRLELRLGDPADSGIDRRAAAAVPERTPGRGITTTRHHFRAFLPRIDGSRDTEDVGAALRAAVSAVDAAWTGERAPRARLLPTTVDRSALDGDERVGRRFPIGQDIRLRTVYLDPEAEPHFVAFADGESGKTNLLRTIMTGITGRYTGREAVILLVDYRRTLLGFLNTDHLLAYAVSSIQLDDMMRDVRDSMRKRRPGPDVTQEQLRNRSWWRGPELFIVVDDYDLVATADANPLGPVVEFLGQAKDVGLHLVLVRRTGGAGRAVSDPVLGRLRELGTPGLVMSGSPDEGHLLGRVKPAPMPPGRGTLVSRRSGQELMQVAWTDPSAVLQPELPGTVLPDPEQPGAVVVQYGSQERVAEAGGGGPAGDGGDLLGVGVGDAREVGAEDHAVGDVGQPAGPVGGQRGDVGGEGDADHGGVEVDPGVAVEEVQREGQLRHPGVGEDGGERRVAAQHLLEDGQAGVLPGEGAVAAVDDDRDPGLGEQPPGGVQ
ncbi:FtsK/SpoIIIE family protein, putative EssC component of Type VII secretion system [Actinokineospora spheciospongiae]|uniref:FtsK/SpoIIIE family protein, putative EssC component of Type VII secretion system n=1 Tax=Actinokineospora spheciospongiae TaxID=909613 RepID=W7IEP2_9PSEU|nr:FtsK/SpoIIIE family protein, putative EssC component of Type VII secretion system [Actinokineospora spheciospongiae]